MIFAFLLSNREMLDTSATKSGLISIHHVPAILVGLLFFIVLASMLTQANPAEISWIKAAGDKTIEPSDNTVRTLGINLMTRYLVPFEVVSVLLMMALVGAAHLARKERKS